MNYITPEGLIHVKRNGGVDHQIAPGMRVLIHGKKGPIKAVFGWPAIHTRIGNDKEPQPKVGIHNVQSIGLHHLPPRMKNHRGSMRKKTLIG